MDLFISQTKEFRGECLRMGKRCARNEGIALEGLLVALEATHENSAGVAKAADYIAVRGLHQRRPRLGRVIEDLVGGRHDP
jgi:hypothetical protein